MSENEAKADASANSILNKAKNKTTGMDITLGKKQTLAWVT